VPEAVASNAAQVGRRLKRGRSIPLLQSSRAPRIPPIKWGAVAFTAQGWSAGNTQFIAAMRAYVASTIGSEVELPAPTGIRT
jgi:hypothetical protein